MPEDPVAHTLEAERAVLGAVIANDERLTDVLDVVTPADFFRDAHRRVFQTMLALSEESTPIDPVTLTERLKRDGALEGVGGPAYVASLADGVPRSTNARSYAEAVCDAARIRRLEQAAKKILALAREREDDAETLIGRAEQIIFGLSQHRVRSDVLDGQALAARAYQLVDLLLDTKQHVSGTPSGYHDFDVMTRGLQPGTLVLIAARPSMGKTSFALNLAWNAAVQHRHTLIYSLEMSRDEVLVRLISSIARIDAHRLQSGYVNQTDYARISDAIQAISDSYIHVNDSPNVSLMDVRGEARRMKAKHGLSLVVLDYLQLTQLPKAENRNLAVADVSRGLKLIARELGVPMVVLSQLSRDTERRGGDKKPMLSDLRDSGALEQDADVVLFIHRPEVYQPTADNSGLAELIIAKQRNGPTGTVRLRWSKELTRFDNMSQAHA